MAVEQRACLGWCAVGLQCSEDVFHHRANVAADRYVRLEHAAELCGVAIDLGDFFAGQQFGVP